MSFTVDSVTGKLTACKSNGLLLVCLALGFLFYTAMQAGYTYNYHPSTEAEKSALQADREIVCSGFDAFDIGIKKSAAEISSKRATAPHLWLKNEYFAPEQIFEFLKFEKHKNMLVVRVSKYLIGKPYEFRDIKPFLESLGYKRFLVIRDVAFFPIPVLLDETMDDPDLEKKEQSKPTQASVTASAAVSNADLNAMRTELKIDPDRWIQNEAEQLPIWWRQSILKKARQLEKEGHYEEALNDLLRVVKVCPDPDVNLHLALCYAHMHRNSDALALMNKLPDCIWTIKAEIYKELGMYEEALAACNEPTMIFNEPVLKLDPKNQATS